MIKIVSNNNVKNNQIISKEEMKKILDEKSPKIYEVIRVIEKKPIFMKEHFDRMNESIKLSGLKDFLSYNDFKNSIQTLINENCLENNNIQVSYYNEDQPVTLFYFIESHYPSKQEFNEGIHTVTMKIERTNPNIKSYQKDFKENIQKVMKDNSAFEVILMNNDGTISEGSRSNVFFVKGNKLFTSPDSLVLLGVTRSKVIQVCEENFIEVERKISSYDKIKDYDAAFITGTSNDVLPIKTIDYIIFNSSENEVVKKVSKLYLEEVKKEME